MDGMAAEDVIAKANKMPKFSRTAAQDWLLAADHQLIVITGQGLCRFMPHGCDPVEYQNRPLCIFLLDKGSDGFAAIWYVFYALNMGPCQFLMFATYHTGTLMGGWQRLS